MLKIRHESILLDSEDIFIDLLTDGSTGTVTHKDMQAAMLRGDEAYSWQSQLLRVN